MEIVYQIESVFTDILLSFLPMVIFFIIFQLFYLKMPSIRFLKILRSIMIAFIGMVLFITGVNISFLTSGEILGTVLGENSQFISMVFIGFVLGVLVTLAEPAVKVLIIEVERETSGSINSYLLVASLAIGVGIAVSVSLLRLIFDIPFVYLIFGLYAMILLLMIKTSSTFTALAFDSGGVVTGPMIATFIMAFMVGAAQQLSDDPLRDGFGMIALVAGVPILTIMLLGLLYKDER